MNKDVPPPSPERSRSEGGKKPPPPGEDSAPPPAGDGVPFDDILNLPLSQTLRGAIEEGRRWAQHERFRGLFGTGMMLLALVRTGENAPPSEPHYAPRFFFDQIKRAAGEKFDSARTRFLDENRLPSGEPGTWPVRASRNLWNVFQAAGLLPRHDEITAARHLIVALLMHEPTGFGAGANGWRILANAGIDRESILDEFLHSLAQQGPPAERAAWAKITARDPSPVEVEASPDSGTPVPAGPLIAGYHPDTPTGRAADDCLDLDSTVSAMANLIASPQLDGTLSLGVFGNWGSGKSFFMGRLREEINAITAHARREEATGVHPAYWPNIAQVEFNAWHYVDANLWASVMSHLLEQLRRWSPAGAKTAGPTALESAIDKLQITAAARGEAERRVQAAREARSAAETKLQNAQQDRQRVARDLAEIAAASLLDMAAKKIAAPVDDARKVFAEVESLRADASQAVEPIVARVRELTTTAGRARTVVQELVGHRHAGREIAIVAAIVGAPLVALLAASLVENWEWLRSAGTTLVVGLTGALGALAKAVAWVQKNSAAVLAQLAPLFAVRDQIEAALSEAESRKARSVSAAEAAVAACDTVVDAAVAEVAACEEAARVAVQAVSDAASGRAISRFIEARLAAREYEKHLGLIATIRRDFDQLSELIHAHNETRRGLTPEAQEKLEGELLKAMPETSPAELAGLLANIGINRIVLYIDDLDRCPSKHVVEVLQAIHLLLSFPIFVVVVGVDSRWMKHSLAREYPSLLTRAPDGETATRGWSREAGLTDVTPEDYLEKIFQIPFWVPPLKTSSARMLIGKLTDAVSGAVPFGAGPEVGASPAGALSGTDAPAAVTKKVELVAAINESRGATTSAADRGPPGAEETAPPVVRMRPDLLRVADEERVAMQSLAALIGRSPRATKRFVNSYRLLKVALVAKEPARFRRDSESAGDLTAPMFLLGIVTGLPTLAAEYVRMLPANPASKAVDQLVALADWAGADAQHADAVKRIREFRASADAKQWNGLSGRDLSSWSTRVAQFSFEDLVPSEERGSPASGSADAR